MLNFLKEFEGNKMPWGDKLTPQAFKKLQDEFNNLIKPLEKIYNKMKDVEKTEYYKSRDEMRLELYSEIIEIIENILEK